MRAQYGRLARGFLWTLALIGAVLSFVPNWLSKMLNKYDPFDNLGLWLSPWKRRYHCNSAYFNAALVAGFALACAHVLPANAAPVWHAKHGAIQYYSFGKIGALTAVSAYAVGAQQQVRKLPFRYGTVRRRINIGNFTLTPGTQLPAVTIPQVGMLSRVLFDVEGSYTVATAPLVVANLDGFDAIFARAQIMMNNGSAQCVDLSGVGVNIINQSLSPSLPVKKGSPLGAGNVNGIQMPLALGASTFTYKGILPVNANNRRQFEMGLINLQAPELRVTLLFSFNTLATLFTVPANCTLFAATINISYEYFEIPDLNRFQLPPLTLVRTIEDGAAPIAATGVQLYQFPRLGTMIDYHAVVVLNLLYANVLNVLTEFVIRYNKSDQQYDILIGDFETYEAELYGNGMGIAPTPSAATPAPQTMLTTQALSFNLWSAGDIRTNGGDFRDAIDTEENTTTEALITVKTGTTLNSGKDNIFHVRRVVQRIIPVASPTRALAA